MTSPRTRVSLGILAFAAGCAAIAAAAQVPLPSDDIAATRTALRAAEAQGAAARARAQTLEANAARAADAAERTAQEAAGIAARIQQSEAGITANEARAALITGQRAALRARLAQRQRPLVQLTAALQRLSRRPLLLSLLHPGSVRDTAYLRAVLETMLPEVQRRTAALRAELARSRALQAQALTNAAALRSGRRDLAQRRAALAALESQQRLASRAASGVADRESERALALAEQAADLTTLVGQLGEAGVLRDQLARLPGPVLRPAQPAQAATADIQSPPPSAAALALGRYMLPVAGQLVSGFGDSQPGKARSRGIAIAAREAALIVAPAGGRVVFAGPYQGYGGIVIIEHEGGWTTLVTGLAQLSARVGQRVVGGGPLGTAGPGRPVVTLELRRSGEPVNPLDYLRG